jgi:predicted signal transduction protein with EAL and GGDEF domain
LLIDARSFSISGSIGIALYPADADNPSDLLARADLAMSKVKRAGGGYRFYKNEMTQALTRKLDIIHRLKSSISERNLQLY